MKNSHIFFVQSAMLRRIVNTGTKRLFRVPPRSSALCFSRRLSDQTKEVYTKINDTKDPARNQFFQYTWGSWMKNDKLERARRQTRFSIEGLSKFAKDFKPQDAALGKPEHLTNGTVALKNNWTKEILGETGHDVKSIASIHEGKHHRIYKVTLANDRQLVLRIPYRLESDYAIENKINSEVATLDFLALKLKLNVPRVLAYGPTRTNILQTPFILMEYIEGDLLMKQWNPLVPDSETSEEELKKVIDPIMEFQDKLLSVTFNRFGSLYFFDDVSAANQKVVPYDEEDNLLKDRWRIGPSTELVFSKNKKQLASQKISQFNGPWDSVEKMLKDLAEVQVESLRFRLGLAQADSSNQVEDVDQLKKQIQTFENFKIISDKLLNPSSPAIKNVEELFKPRLFVPDLDPLNVIVEQKSSKPFFIDFEHTVIKPFILASYPAFVAYQGTKLYNLEEEIPGFKDMDDVEKQQYEFMYYKTRNERLWEFALNNKRHDLIAVASPHIKVLKAPYLQVVNCKTDKDFMFIENAIIQLQAMWEAYVANQICNSTTPEFPIENTAEYLDEHQSDLENYQLEVASTPFAATGGWVPQDMFDVLKEQNILVEDENGNYKIEADAALKNPPKDP